MKDLLPWVGDRRAAEAWDEVFSRDVLGAVVLGGASGKLVENVVALVVLYVLGPDAPPVWETVGFIMAWAVALPVGIWIFAYWHKIEQSAEEVADAVTGED